MVSAAPPTRKRSALCRMMNEKGLQQANFPIRRSDDEKAARRESEVAFDVLSRGCARSAIFTFVLRNLRE